MITALYKRFTYLLTHKKINITSNNLLPPATSIITSC